MRLVSRNDTYLLGGMAMAGAALFSGQGLPALVILVAAFIVHQQRKRHEARAEVERLVAFGQALAGTLDEASIRAVAAAHVPALAPDPPENDHQRSVLAAAQALLALSLKNAELFREVHENSVRDALTGCANRKHALETIDIELKRARRSKMPVSLVMFDLDHFKQVNDSFGHLCGDAVLAAIGQRMNATLRSSDLKCRYGGEEFLALLPDTPLAGAQRVAETLRRELEAHAVPWQDARVPITASFGVTTAAPGELDVLALLGRADAALYRAKQDGRNCIRVAEPRDAIV